MTRWSFLLALSLATAPALADDRGAPEGFTPLFDGKTLDGWRMVNTKDNFYAKDGRLVMDKGSGWLATEKTFGDFELRVHYRFITPGADSGIFIRSSLEGKNWTGRGYQVQNMDNETLGMVVGMGIKVQGERKPDVVKRVKKPAGEFNDLVIVARGKHVDVTLNGEPVASSDDLTLKDGHIGLQAEGGVLEFERIDIKTLSGGGGDRSRVAAAPTIDLKDQEEIRKAVQEKIDRLQKVNRELEAEDEQLKVRVREAREENERKLDELERKQEPLSRQIEKERKAREQRPKDLVGAAAVPESIIAEDVPAVPDDLVRALNRYQNLRSASFQDWVGDRGTMLITTRFADTSQVHRVAGPGRARYQLTFSPERVLAARGRPHSDQFLFVMDQGGAENYQLYLQDLASGDARLVSDGKSRHTAPKWSTSGKLLAFSSNARNGKDMDLYLLAPEGTKSPRLLKEVSGDWSVADWSPDDRTVAAVETISINETYVHLVDVESGRTETITPRGATDAPRVAYANVRWAKDGKALYWTSDLDSEFRRLVRYDLESKKSTVLTADIPWDIDDFDLADDGRTIAFVANEDGIDRLHVYDVKYDRERRAPRIPVGQIGGLKFRPGSTDLGFTLESARATGDAYAVDVNGGQLVRWTESETAGLDPEKFSEPELIHYKTFDGREIPAFVYRPGSKFTGRRPVLIQIHGGPEGQARPGFLGATNYLIDELGIALIVPNVRGSSGYGKTYLKLDNGFHREDAVKDIGALIDWIGSQEGLDASRIGVVGGSYGGYMTLATLTHYSDRLRAGIDIVGISSFLTFLKNTSGYRRDLRRAEYGDERDPQMHDFLKAISPLTSVDRIRVPLMIVAGANDPRVPASESSQLVAEVRKNGLPVWSIVGKNEGHGFARKVNRDYLQAAEVVFLKRYLLGE